jgi:hypothetical protein
MGDERAHTDFDRNLVFQLGMRVPVI